VHVIANSFEVAGAGGIDRDGFVTSAEKVAGEFVAAVETAGICAEQPLHAGNEIGFGSFDNEVEMVWHEAIGVDLPGSFFAGGGESFDEGVAVVVVEENGFAAISTIEDVVDGAGVFDAKGAGHVLLALDGA
jgi:hypothetical protein